MIEIQINQAQNIAVTDDDLTVTLSDGRIISVPHWVVCVIRRIKQSEVSDG